MPFIARRSAHFVTRRLFCYPSAHFVTRRLFLLPVGSFRYHRGISVFFPCITHRPCLHLASMPKCPAHALWACRSSAKAPVGCPMALARRESTPLIYAS